MKSFTVKYKNVSGAKDALIGSVLEVLRSFNQDSKHPHLQYGFFCMSHAPLVTFVLERKVVGYGAFRWKTVEESLSAHCGFRVDLSDIVELT